MEEEVDITRISYVDLVQMYAELTWRNTLYRDDRNAVECIQEEIDPLIEEATNRGYTRDSFSNDMEREVQKLFEEQEGGWGMRNSDLDQPYWVLNP